MLKEYRNKTNKRINIYQADKFLEYANKNLSKSTNQEAIDEVRNVRIADEEDLKILFSEKNISNERSVKQKKSNVSDFENVFDEHIAENKDGDD